METLKILGQSDPANANTTLYTCPDQTQTVVSVLNICNRTGGALTARVYVVPKGKSTGTGYAVMYDKSIAANTVDTTLKGLTLRGGDIIVVYASATGLVYSAFGSEVS